MNTNVSDKKNINLILLVLYIVLNFIFSNWTELLNIHVGNSFTFEYILFLVLYIAFSIAVFIYINKLNLIDVIIIGILNILSIPNIIIMADYNFKFTPYNHVYIITRLIILVTRIIVLIWTIVRIYKIRQLNEKEIDKN